MDVKAGNDKQLLWQALIKESAVSSFTNVVVANVIHYEVVTAQSVGK